MKRKWTNRSLKELHGTVRAHVADLLATPGPQGLYSRLAASARFGTVDERVASITALGVFRYVRSIGFLEANVRDYEELLQTGRVASTSSDAGRVAVQSVWSLSWMDRPTSHEFLKHLCLHSSDPSVRLCALEDLGYEEVQFEASFIYSFLGADHPHSTIVSALDALWLHKRPSDRDPAEKALVLPFLQSALTDVKVAAIQYIAWSDDPRDAELIRPFVDDGTAYYNETVGSVAREELEQLEELAEAAKSRPHPPND